MRTTLARAILLLLFGLVLAGLALSCTKFERVPLDGLPSREQFVTDAGGVSLFLEKRCGALDCHGQIGRPMRVYSQDGLRRDLGPGGRRDTSPTTEKERFDNYDAVVGLEPDAVAECLRTNGDYQDFQLLVKPLDESGRGVKHKGGPVLARTNSDPGWACLYGWLSGRHDPARCAEAAY